MQNFYKQQRAEIDQKSSKNKAIPWSWIFDIWKLFPFFIHVISSSSGCCLAFVWFFANFSLMLLIKVLLIKKCIFYPAGIYLLKVNNRNTRKRCQICSKLTIKTPEQRHSWRHSGVFIVKFEHISHLLLVFLLLTLKL